MQCSWPQAKNTMDQYIYITSLELVVVHSDDLQSHILFALYYRPNELPLSWFVSF